MKILGAYLEDGGLELFRLNPNNVDLLKSIIGQLNTHECLVIYFYNVYQ